MSESGVSREAALAASADQSREISDANGFFRQVVSRIGEDSVLTLKDIHNENPDAFKAAATGLVKDIVKQRVLDRQEHSEQSHADARLAEREGGVFDEEGTPSHFNNLDAAMDAINGKNMLVSNLQELIAGADSEVKKVFSEAYAQVISELK